VSNIALPAVGLVASYCEQYCTAGIRFSGELL